MKKKPIVIFTDGSCDNNRSRKMGIGIYAKYNYKELKFSKYIGLGTNNIAELMAILYAIKKCRIYRNIPLIINTDSEYSINVITGKYKPKKNIDLIMEIREAASDHCHVSYQWVKGHSKSKGNNIADRLAYNIRKDNE